MNSIQITKAHGTGNDFVLTLDMDDAVVFTDDMVSAVCNRHFGIGGDGLIRISAGREAPFFMDYRNADGSIAEMCGNGIRCLAKFVADRGLVDDDEFDVETRAGVRHVSVRRSGGLVSSVTVKMGVPNFARADIPVSGPGADALDERIAVRAEGGIELSLAAVSMGNPHAVIFVDDTRRAPVLSAGPEIEKSDLFPEGVNIEFVEVLSRSHLRMRIWERGVGETLSCGTGACAAIAVSATLDRSDREVRLDVPGGRLHLAWDEEISMTGPAVEVFDAELDLDRLSAGLPETA